MLLFVFGQAHAQSVVLRHALLDVRPLFNLTIRTQLAIQLERDVVVGGYDGLRVVLVVDFTLISCLLFYRHLA